MIDTQEKKAESIVPKAPTGTRMSPKGKVLIGGIFAMLGCYLLWAVFGLSPKAAATESLQESTNISSSELNNQEQQGHNLMTQLDTAAYGTGSAQGANPGETPETNGGSIPTNMPSLASNDTSQGTTDQSIQNGMQSGLTPNGFESGNDMTNSTSNNTAPGTSLPPAMPLINSSGTASTDDQNMQGEKNAFLQNKGTQNDRLSTGVQQAVSSNMVMAGSIIPATLITGIDSDLPGQIEAQVSQNVYDSKTGNNILIPQGSKLLGTYDSQVAYGQSRVLIVWTRVIFPNDQYIDLEGMPGADLSGFAGLHDQVDNHYIRIYGSALLMSLFSAGMQLSQPNNNSSNGAPTNQQIIAGAMGQQLGQTSTELIQKNINVQPTINIRPGDNFNVLVTRDIPFTGPYNDGAAE